MQHPAGLLAAWRERAAYLERYGDPNSARLWKEAIRELEHVLQAIGDETLSLAEAAAASGFTADHLGHLIRTGKIPNAGVPNRPRIRRADLPQKKSNGRGRPVQRRLNIKED